jgi:uncharacterized protein (TIGR02231 family)
MDRRSTAHRIAFFLSLLVGSFGSHAADLSLQLPIDRVTVYREGAIVTRAGQAEIPAGEHRLIVAGLPADVAENALRVEVDSAQVKLGGIEVRVINETDYVSEAERELRRKRQVLQDQRNALQDDINANETQLKLLDGIASSPTGSSAKPAVDAASLGSVIATVGTSSTAARTRIREAKIKLRTIGEQESALDADLKKVATERKSTREVRASLTAQSAVKTSVTVSYLSASAGWEWVYEARLDTTAKQLVLTRQGAVRQGSGEDWKNVAITLTTATPSEKAATPKLASMFLDLAEPESKAPNAFRKNAAGGSGLTEEIIVTARKREEVEVVATEYVADYKVPGRASIIADREPHLYPIGEDTMPVDLLARTVPSIERSAYLEAAFNYDREVPFQRGRVQLYRDGAFVGEAALPSLQPGSDVRVPFGIDERVRVNARDEKGESGDRGLFGRQTTKEYRRRFDITNYHPSPLRIEVIDRVPVPKNSDVHVEILKGSTDPTKKDLDGKAGVWLWQIDAQPKQTAVIRHYVSVRYPKDRELITTEADDESDN